MNVVTFEFDSDNAVAPDSVLVPYTNVATAAQMAQAVVNAINAHPVLGTLASANVTGARVYLVSASFAAETADLTAESNDTRLTAVDSGLSSLNSGTFIASGVIGDNPNLVADPTLDVDMISFQLNAGDRVRIDIDAEQLGQLQFGMFSGAFFGLFVDPTLALFDAAGNLVDFSFDAPAPGEGLSFDAYLDFTATTSGTYYLGISAFGNFGYNPDSEGSGFSFFSSDPPPFLQGSYMVTIILGSGAVAAEQFDFTGDENQFREQGQILIDSNVISNFSDNGILVDAAPRDAEGNVPRQASVRNTRNPNTTRLVPGVAIQNNLITNVGQAGITFSGDPNPANQPLAAVPFGRIVNNTIWGGIGTSGVGIRVTDNASPTILNNILANLATGITVDASSRRATNPQTGQLTFSGTVISANLYRSASTTAADTGAANNGLGDLAIVLTPAEPLFEDENLGVFSPARGSKAIDSSLDSVEDRPELTTVTSPLGIGLSPILAPEFDLDGVLRVDDPSQAPPPGLGSNVFKDRGALERIDQPRISISGGSVVEGNQGNVNLVFTITIDQFTSSLLTVDFATNNGTASGGVDYVNTNGKITFVPGGGTVQQITVQVIGDSLDEDDETFQVNLNSAVNGLILSGQATGTIIDDDTAPTITVSDVTLVEGNNPNVVTPFVFTVSLAQPSGRTVSAVFNTANVTATAGSDYQATTGTITFQPGQTRQFVTVNVLGDVTPETNETFRVTLSQLVNATAPAAAPSAPARSSRTNRRSRSAMPRRTKAIAAPPTRSSP